MVSRITYFQLGGDADWEALRAFISTKKLECVANVLGYLRLRGLRAVVIENEYLDKDFTREFASFYALVFKRHRKICRRIHFFGASLALGSSLSSLTASLKKVASEGGYFGYMVVRPVEGAPVGRTVIAVPEPSSASHASVLVQARHEAHLLGVELVVEGSPFAQQDSRVGACAHASIWMGARHLHVKHREGWFSTVDIAERASTPADTTLASSLPSGSGGLNLNNMVRAVRAMGREPIIYLAEEARNDRVVNFAWPADLQPADVIDRYIDSGIPVILALSPWIQGQAEGHAVTCFGHVQERLPEDTVLGVRPTTARLTRYFLVNDDQRGCYLRMPASGESADQMCSQTPYSLQNVHGVLIPLPRSVYLKAETAEVIAWDLVAKFAGEWGQMRSSCSCDTSYVESYIAAYHSNRLVARTYLTHGWKYKRRISNNNISEEAKELIVPHDLPRFVWVTEFGVLSDINCVDPRERRILSHVVVDATSGQYWSSGPLIFHAPGFVWTWSHNDDDECGPYEVRVWTLKCDAPYMPRLRGQAPRTAPRDADARAGPNTFG